MLIYESTDGGITIYARKSGSNERVLIQQDATQANPYHRWHYWRAILEEAKNNETLNNAIEQAEVIYQLSKDRNSN